MTRNAASAKQPLLTLWDGVTALIVGVVCFVMSLFHQETLGVALLSGAASAVVMLVILPILRRLMNRPGVPRG